MYCVLVPRTGRPKGADFLADLFFLTMILMYADEGTEYEVLVCTWYIVLCTRYEVRGT